MSILRYSRLVPYFPFSPRWRLRCRVRIVFYQGVQRLGLQLCSMFVWVNKWRPRCIAPKRRGDLGLDKKYATALECPRMAGGGETECPISPGKPSLPRETLQIPSVKIRTMRPSTCKPAKGIFSSYIWFWSCNHLLSRQFLISYSKLRETSGRFSQTVCFVQTWKTAEKISPLLMIMQLDQPPPNIRLSIDDNLIGRYLLLLCVGRCHNP